MKLKSTLPIVLAAALFSYPVLATESTEKRSASIIQELKQIDDSFEQIQDPEVTLMRKYGEPVDISITQGPLKVTVEYILADPYTTTLLIAVEKVDGMPFKSTQNIRLKNIDWISKQEKERAAKLAALPADAPYVAHLKIMAEDNPALLAFIQADDTVDMDGLIASIQASNTSDSMISGTSGSSHGMRHIQDNTDSKIYFTYETTTYTPTSDDMILSIEGVVNEIKTNQPIATDLTNYLSEHQKDTLVTVPNPLDSFDLKYLEELQKTNTEAYERYKEELDARPQVLLGEGGLGLALIPDDSSCVIDNIGFIDSQLHIRMIGEGLRNTLLNAYTETDEQIDTTYHTNSSRTLTDGTEEHEAYRIFEIDSIASLKNCTFKINKREIVEQWEGPWEIPLDMSHLPAVRVIEVNQMIPYTLDEQALLKEVEIGKASLSLIIEQIKSEFTNDTMTVTVHFKDGSSLIEQYPNATLHAKEQLTLIYSSKDFVGKEIASLQIGEQHIPIQ